MRIVPPPGAARADRHGQVRVGRPRPRQEIGRAPELDPLDRLIGRAVIDARFRALLLADPLTALRTEQMPLRLKRALITIRARGLGEFAVRALDIQADLRVAERLGRVTRRAARKASTARRLCPDVAACDPGPACRRCATKVTYLVARNRKGAPHPAPTPAMVRPLR